MKIKTPELLAPSGSPEALRAAVQNGADAVYLGWGGFNARQSAKNFSDEEFSEALTYCHVRGVRVFLTLNTLLTDRELPKALETATIACRLGVDAVLIQDWGLFDLLRRVLPDLPVHASTQMSIFTSGAAAEVCRDGCERVVLARECSAADIREICRRIPAEVEVFAHGALCMCYSGQCAMSALIGGRSGNRGRCAQPCRMAYGFDKPSKDQFPLSLKDSCLADALGELTAMGVSCLKLEGRMKRPEYVAAVTRIYARLLQEKRRPTPDEMSELKLAFSRSGFTDGYWRGKRGVKMFGTRPENEPEPRKFFAELRADYEKERRRTVPIQFSCTVQRDRPCTLIVSDEDGHVAQISGPVPEIARTRNLTEEELRSRLQKTGGTPYHCTEVVVELEEGLSLSAGAINAMRRNALAALTELRISRVVRRELAVPPIPENCSSLEPPHFTVSVLRTEQLTEQLLDLQPARIYVPLEELAAVSALPDEKASGTEWCVILPRVWRDRDEEQLSQWLTHAQSLGVAGALLGNIGHLSLLRGYDWNLYGDFGLNVWNSRSLEFLQKKGLRSACVSFELRFSQIRDLKKPLPTEAIVYGRLPLMITENCLTQNALGCSLDRSNSVPPEDAPCRNCHTLQDQTGAAFPLLPAYGHRTEVQNSVPLWLADVPEWRRSGLHFARLRFTTETPKECVQIFQDYLSGRAASGKFTRGLYKRGVE